MVNYILQRAASILVLVCLLAVSGLSSNVTIGASEINNFNRTDIGSDVTVSNITATSGSPNLTCSSCFPSNVVGLAGWRITINGTDYTAASCLSRSAVTLTANFASATSTYSGTLRKFIHLRVYLIGPAFTPLGATVPIQPGGLGTSNWYKRVAASVQNDGSTNILYVPEFTLPATTDGSPATSRWSAALYLQSGGFIQMFPGCIDSWRLNAADDPTSWTDICSFNVTNPPPPTGQDYYTEQEVNNFLPTCSINQLIYNLADGRPKRCLTVGTGLAISGGALNSTGISTAYSTIQEEGAGLTQRSILNFVGSGVTAADDTTRTTVTVASPLNALASNSTAGLWAPTGAVTGNARTLTGTANEITVTNGDGAGGNPTISLPAAITATGKTVTGGTYVNPTITNPTLTANLRQAINVKNYGCVGDDVTDDTTCITNAYTAAVAAGGFYLYFPTGTYLFDGLSVTASNLIIVGDGPGRSILHSRVNTAAVITINNTAAARNNITIRDLELKGFGSGASNHGLATTGTNARNSLTVENVKISTVGGSNILSSGGALSNSRFVDLDLDSPSTASGHTIDIVGAGDNQIIRAYVHNVADNLTAFRLRGVNWLFDSVTAQDTGSTGTGWGIIGEDVAQDGQSTPTFLDCRGCIIQLWSGADAVDFRANSYGSFRYSTISTASSGLNKRAFRFRGVTAGQTGIFDAESKITLNGTATWANSLPVHSVEAPFLEVGAEEISSYYDTSLSTSVAMAGIRQVRVDSARSGVSIKNLATGTSAGTGFISNLLFAIDNTYNIGTAASGQRPANIYVSSTGFFNNAIQVGSPSASTGEARLYNSSNSNAVRLGAPAGASDYAFTFPSSLPTAGTEFLQISNVGAVTSTPAPWINTGVVSSTQTTVANTVTETDLIGTVDAGSKTISANTAKQFRVYSVRLSGPMNDTGTPTIRFQLKLGSTVIADTTAVNLVTITGGGCIWELETFFSFLTLGATGTVRVHKFSFTYDISNGAQRYHVASSPGTTVIDTTTSQQIVLTVTWGTANASNTITRDITLIDQAR